MKSLKSGSHEASSEEASLRDTDTISDSNSANTDSHTTQPLDANAQPLDALPADPCELDV